MRAGSNKLFPRWCSFSLRDCSVKTVHAFGAFVEFSPGIEGLVHVSELDIGRVVTAEGFLVDKPTVRWWLRA